MAPKVSIIVPVHNEERFIAECLDSALSQSFSDFEIICSNDASTDGSAAILADYAARDPRIRVIEGSFDGPSATRNAALALASGHYIAFLDSDDWWEDGMLEAVVSRADETGADIVVFDYWLYDQSTGEKGTYRDQHLFARYNGNVANLAHAVGLAGFAGIWDRLFRKSFLDAGNFAFVEGRLYEDAMYSYETLVAAEKIAIMSDHLYNYRRNVNASITYTEDEGAKHKEDFVFAQAYIQACLRKAGIPLGAWHAYAGYFAEYAYMHNRELHPFSRFRDFFEVMREMAFPENNDLPRLFDLWRYDENPGRRVYIDCIRENRPRLAYMMCNAANAAGSIVHRR